MHSSFFFEQCIWSLTHLNHSPSFMKTNFFWKKLSQRENIFVHSFWVRERKKHKVVCRKRTLCFFFVLWIILSQEADVRESQSTTNCVRGKIYFKEIVSNTRLDLNCLSFTHLVCKLLIICRFLLIYIQYLFVVFAYHIYLYYCLYLDLYAVPLVNHKSKLLTYIQQ